MFNKVLSDVHTRHIASIHGNVKISALASFRMTIRVIAESENQLANTVGKGYFECISSRLQTQKEFV